jgi:hypothetical protein
MNDITVLIGEKGLACSLRCLKSLIWSIGPKKINMHLDGPVTEYFLETINKELNADLNVIKRGESDEFMNEVLRRHPECSKFRHLNVMGLKLLDVMLYKDNTDLMYFDTDIYFLNKVDLQEVLNWQGPVFMEDYHNSYSLRPWDIFPLGKLVLAGRICAGFTKFPAKYFDLDFIEWFLKLYGSSRVALRRAYWVEQTCWAALAGRVRNTGVIGKPNFVFPKRMSKREDLCGNDAIHFVSTYRGKMGLMGDEKISSSKISTFTVKKAKVIGPFDILRSDLKRKFKIEE